MKFDTVLLFHNLERIVGYAKAAEALGFDGIWTAETGSNPFLPLILAAEHSSKVTFEAMHAIWDTRENGTPLRYNGEFFNRSLMVPFFAPAPLKLPRPPIAGFKTLRAQ